MEGWSREATSGYTEIALLQYELEKLRAELAAKDEVIAEAGEILAMRDRQLAANAALKEKLSEANKERAWVRRKLEIPEDTGFLSGDVTLAGTMHNVWSGYRGYHNYIAATTNFFSYAITGCVSFSIIASLISPHIHRTMRCRPGANGRDSKNRRASGHRLRHPRQPSWRPIWPSRQSLQETSRWKAGDE